MELAGDDVGEPRRGRRSRTCPTSSVASTGSTIVSDGQRLDVLVEALVVVGEVEQLGVDHARVHDVDADVGVAQVDVHATPRTR